MARPSHLIIVLLTPFIISVWYCMMIGFLAGCNAEIAKPKTATQTHAITATVTDPTPGVVEITSVKAQRNTENIVSFEVEYKFTSGKPIKNYMLNLGFPGTSIAGQKPMDSWEVKPEGTIKTGLPVADIEAMSYEVTFSEADSPDRGYTIISNKFAGVIELAVESVSK